MFPYPWICTSSVSEIEILHMWSVPQSPPKQGSFVLLGNGEAGSFMNFEEFQFQKDNPPLSGVPWVASTHGQDNIVPPKPPAALPQPSNDSINNNRLPLKGIMVVG